MSIFFSLVAKSSHYVIRMSTWGHLLWSEKRTVAHTMLTANQYETKKESPMLAELETNQFPKSVAEICFSAHDFKFLCVCRIEESILKASSAPAFCFHTFVEKLMSHHNIPSGSAAKDGGPQNLLCLQSKCR